MGTERARLFRYEKSGLTDTRVPVMSIVMIVYIWKMIEKSIKSIIKKKK